MRSLEHAADREADMRAAFARGELRTTAEIAFQRYGQEILAFLVARLHDRTRGEDAFSMFAEDFWRGLHEFDWRSSLRCWAYKLACNAACRLARAPYQRVLRNLPISQLADTVIAEGPGERVTPAFRRTDVKQRMSALRMRLSDDDQVLLMLRVDRRLPFRELALVLGACGDADDEELARAASTLRKRFERLKRELRTLAIAEGLITPDA